MTDLGVESPETLPMPSSPGLSSQDSIGVKNVQAKETPVGTLPVTGFVAGIASGVTKLIIGHPFDTLKVRLQVSGERFDNSVVKCLKSTVRKEGLRGLYKGGTPPLFGWAVMDSVMLGSLSNYRRLLAPDGKLALWQHTLAGLGAGLTVSLVATPIEHVKARLQVQYDAHSTVYKGPIDVITRLVRSRDLYNGLTATMVQRSWFSVFWATYAVTIEQLKETSLSASSKSFLAGGTASTLYWVFAFPFDVAKQRIMTDSLVTPKYTGWWHCMRTIKLKDGWKGYYRGFTPCFLRAFPTNASAVLVFDTTMRYLGQFGY